MTRTEALRTLAAKVDAGSLDWPYCAVQHVHGIGMNKTMWNAYHGSLDAAKALHEAVLPGWYFDIDSEDGRVCVFERTLVNAELGQCSPLSRSWLLAIIKALIAEEEKI